MVHTPGPWVVEGESGNNGEAEVIVSDKRTICWTACSLNEDDDFTSDEDRANALLIAAAPELLAALKRLTRHADGDLLPRSHRSEALNAALDAIKKAERKPDATR
jgi:hypothetical protein